MIIKYILSIIVVFLSASQLYCEEKTLSKPIGPVTSGENSSTTFSDSEATRKIIERTNLEREGRIYAKYGLYEKALLKYNTAMNPALLNYEHEISTAKWSIEQIYKRQSKFEQALQMVEDKLKSLSPQKEDKDVLTGTDELERERLELLSFIKARDTHNNAPIYEYMSHLRTKSKYAKLFPSKGYAVGISDWLINDLIHLYDYLHDYDAGIAFMDEIIKYHSNHPDKNHRSAHAKDVKEYTRVKQAWELDKKTGQHGHLQDVIRTSDVISW